MNHFYDTIPGMFNFQEVYRLMVEEAPDPAHFVEVGTFLGKSAAFMAVEIANSGKEIVFDVVDTFHGSPTVEEEGQAIDERTGDYYSRFLTNMQPVLGMVRPFPTHSLDASQNYYSDTLDFVFIDANHQYYAIKTDIDIWLPKVKPGGYIGGHDYRSNCPGVWKAVRERFETSEIKRIGTSWLVRK